MSAAESLEGRRSVHKTGEELEQRIREADPHLIRVALQRIKPRLDAFGIEIITLTAFGGEKKIILRGNMDFSTTTQDGKYVSIFDLLGEVGLVTWHWCTKKDESTEKWEFTLFDSGWQKALQRSWDAQQHRQEISQTSPPGCIGGVILLIRESPQKMLGLLREVRATQQAYERNDEREAMNRKIQLHVTSGAVKAYLGKFGISVSEVLVQNFEEVWLQNIKGQYSDDGQTIILDREGGGSPGTLQELLSIIGCPHPGEIVRNQTRGTFEVRVASIEVGGFD